MVEAIKIAIETKRFSSKDFFFIYDKDTLHNKNSV